MGAVGKVAIDSDGQHIWAVVRCERRDRGNNRIQIFDQDGKSLSTPWTQFGKPSGIAFD